jgi:hypothetical protein
VIAGFLCKRSTCICSKDLDTRSRGLIDHLFVRALQLVLLTLILCSVAAWILLRRFSARRPERGERLHDRAA